MTNSLMGELRKALKLGAIHLGWRVWGHQHLNEAVLIFGHAPLLGDMLWFAWGRWQRVMGGVRGN